MDPTATFDLHDIQGYILRGYRMDLTRHFVLQIVDADGARRFIGRIVEHDPALHAQAVNRQPDTTPQITTAADWGQNKPDYTLNIGFTCAGLTALQVPQLDSFPQEFRDGPTAPARAALVGDTGASAPEHWIDKLDTTNAANVHILLTLYALTTEVLERTSALLRDLFRAHLLAELACFDARALESYQTVRRERTQFDAAAFPKVHFGYTDGIAQPTIDGAPATFIPDGQPKAPLGEFLLGYPSQFSPNGYPVPQPSVLGQNGSFAAFRILQQDVAGFERFLEANATPTMDKELLAAKLCGRWRNGVPLVLSPDTDTPSPPVSAATIDNFSYANDDPQGLRCPIGAHIRRTNPRDERVQGDGHSRRIIRRAMPYGPPYDPTQPDDGIARGLVGLFVNVSIADQFEFVMRNWVNDSAFAGGLKGPHGELTRDVLLGNNSDSSEQNFFRIPTAAGPVFLTGFSSFVTTRGAAYLFLPSISALHYLAEFPAVATADGVTNEATLAVSQ